MTAPALQAGVERRFGMGWDMVAVLWIWSGIEVRLVFNVGSDAVWEAVRWNRRADNLEDVSDDIDSVGRRKASAASLR